MGDCGMLFKALYDNQSHLPCRLCQHVATVSVSMTGPVL